MVSIYQLLIDISIISCTEKTHGMSWDVMGIPLSALMIYSKLWLRPNLEGFSSR